MNRYLRLVGGVWLLAIPALAAPLGTGLHRDFSTSWVDPEAETPPVAGKQVAPRRVDQYPHEAVLIETTPLQRYRGSSIGRLVAVDGNGTVHGVHLGENPPTQRHARAWCVAPDTSLTGPESVLEQRLGYPSVACTGSNPPNGLVPHSGVVGVGTETSWFGVDFQGCTLAFLLGSANGELGNPYVAVDWQDKIHGLGRPGFQDSLWYDASVDGEQALGAALVSGGGGVLAAAMTAARQAPGAALLFLRQGPCAADILQQDAPQWGMDLYLAEARDADNNLHAVLAAGDTLNLTRTHCADRRGPLACGAFGYRDADALYDGAETPGLHIALTTPRLLPDTIRYTELAGGQSTVTPFAGASMHSTLWHLNPAHGSWSRIAGWLTGNDEEDEVPWPEIFRVARDRVQLAQDPQTGYLYALWNEFRGDDTSSDGLPNAELLMACSADGGASWGEAVNVSQSATPGCLPGDCESEVSASLAERADGGFLHLSFLQDTCPDDETLTTNAVYYMRVPVGDVPPPAGDAWDAAGHIGLDRYRRPWWFTAGHPDSLRIWDQVGIWNEGSQARRLESLVVYHDWLDEPGGPEDALSWNWDVLRGDPVQPAGWIADPASAADWDGNLPPRSLTLLRLSVTHRGLPLREQAFRFTFDDGTQRSYRFVYEGPAGQGSLVMPMDLDQLESYVADTLYQRGESALPPVTPAHFRLLAAAPNPFNPVTQLSFSLAAPGEAQLAVYNLRGERVAVLVDGALAVGPHRVSFAGDGLASGLYLALLEAEGRRETLKLLLVH